MQGRVAEKKKGVKVHANQSRSHTAVTFCHGCTCPRATCPSASQHSQMQQLTELVPNRGDRGREGLRGWISYIFPRERWREEKRKGGCELISRHIVGCHFYSTQKEKSPKQPIRSIFPPQSKNTRLNHQATRSPSIK